ncbi:ATP-binding protein, partial [Aduncisulcus paluster]
MDSAAANSAMTIGHQREYADGDLGHFGMGLKAASFGHGDVLTVWSTRDFTCEVLSSDSAAAHAADRKAVLGTLEGTSIVWTDMRNVYRGRNPEEARSWLSTRNEALRSHLGVTFHRLLATHQLQIDILIDELGQAIAGP